MRAIQIVSGLSILYFIAQCFFVTAEQARMEALMGILTMSLVFIIASHLYGVQKNDIADEIRENHKRNTNSSVPSNSITHKTNVPSTPTK